jgi:hypothetical protein
VVVLDVDGCVVWRTCIQESKGGYTAGRGAVGSRTCVVAKGAGGVDGEASRR